MSTSTPYVTINGRPVYLASAVALMDDDLREAVHADLAPCDPQVYMDEYCRRHLETFGVAFEVA